MGTICDSETNGYKTLKDEQKLNEKIISTKKNCQTKTFFLKK